MSTLHDLSPAPVWAHFATLCEIPRASWQEAALRDHLIAWAQQHGITGNVDTVGNLILGKPASQGCEQLPGVIMQGHLDMVCQANSGTSHDFSRDPINTVIRDGWVIAEHTTLGADNGIGVALALAALEEPDLQHPALEVLLTINEESGMDGARGLQAGALQGKTLINLDTEEWGHFYLGCAGGVDVQIGQNYALQAVDADQAILRFEVSGLRGGHSGIDIHEGRGNAIKLLAEALRDMAEHTPLQLIEMSGGTARNAIPREAYALVAVSGDTTAEHLEEWVAHRNEVWQERFAAVDAGVKLAIRLVPENHPQHVLSDNDRDQLLAFIDVAMNGVAQVSSDFPGVTDTSSNLGVIALSGGALKMTFKVRSLQDGRGDALAEKLVTYAQAHDLQAHTDGAYPGWTPDPASPLLALCLGVYTEQFGHPASLQVIHAGLECGLLAASHPHLDMISFGPDIRGAHAPGERVRIASVDHCWTLLKAVLQALAKV